MSRILKEYPGISLKVENLDDRVDFAEIFGRQAPVHIEVGSGRGTFLLNQAKARPDIDFLGIEWASKYYRYTVDRIGRWSLNNVRIIRTDAAGFLAGYVPDSSVDCFHVYFPDPWPKKRHHKRRFFKQDNVEEIIRCLKSGGNIRVVTDHEEYFEQINSVLTSFIQRLEKIDFYPAASAEIGEWVGTNFERKYLKENRPIYCIAAMKYFS
jgi:tRNA (guanine-N7-)-methyltransferase